MAITLEMWENYGTPSGAYGAGAGIFLTDNVGWKDSPLDETYEYSHYPINRAHSDDLFSTSYTKYHYFRMYGTYTEIEDWVVNIEGSLRGAGNQSGIVDNVTLIYKWSDTYAEPTKDLLNGIPTALSDKITIPVLRASVISPAGPMVGVDDFAANTVYHTPYLITQLVTFRSDWKDYGNLPADLKINSTLTEIKTGLPNYDPRLIKWTM